MLDCENYSILNHVVRTRLWIRTSWTSIPSFIGWKIFISLSTCSRMTVPDRILFWQLSYWNWEPQVSTFLYSSCTLMNIFELWTFIEILCCLRYFIVLLPNIFSSHQKLIELSRRFKYYSSFRTLILFAKFLEEKVAQQTTQIIIIVFPFILLYADAFPACVLICPILDIEYWPILTTRIRNKP